MPNHGKHKHATKNKKNPLSNARKQNSSASNLWYRKAGLGYKSFIDYYGNSTSLPSSTREEHDLCRQSTTSTKHSLPVSTGMSRAAKRRRKKKHGSVVEEQAVTCLANDDDDDEAPPAAPTAEHSNTRHPLYRAWMEAGKPPHLEAFVSTLCRPLPVTVRIRENISCSIKDRITEELISHGFEPTMTQPNIAFQIRTSKGELSNELRRTLTGYSQSGAIARQELGSMLPVRLLQSIVCNKNVRVLDICASPGSKTLQALEVFEGTIVANDINADRLQILRDAIARSGMNNTERIQYTCQDASTFKLHTKTGDIATFRVILCDVPCSGDGTCRKDPSILPQWKPSIGNNLHSVQLAILRRGLALLKPGGYLCYSTCSMYPVENEAVVAAALEEQQVDGGDNIELVECPQDAFSGLQLGAGLKEWKVAGQEDTGSEDDDGTGMVSYESCASAVKGNTDLGWLPSMWPSSNNDVMDQLCRCRRLWPHIQDSGGFFVALFRKKPMN